MGWSPLLATCCSPVWLHLLYLINLPNWRWESGMYLRSYSSKLYRKTLSDLACDPKQPTYYYSKLLNQSSDYRILCSRNAHPATAAPSCLEKDLNRLSFVGSDIGDWVVDLLVTDWSFTQPSLWHYPASTTTSAQYVIAQRYPKSTSSPQSTDYCSTVHESIAQSHEPCTPSSTV